IILFGCNLLMLSTALMLKLFARSFLYHLACLDYYFTPWFFRSQDIYIIFSEIYFRQNCFLFYVFFYNIDIIQKKRMLNKKIIIFFKFNLVKSIFIFMVIYKK